MKILITGGKGFIGGHLVDYYVNLGHDVYVIDNDLNDHYNPLAKYYNIDLASETGTFPLETILSDADVIFHLAAMARVQPSFENPYWYYYNNIISTLNLLDVLRDLEWKGKLIFTSSSSVYDGLQQFAHNYESDQLYSDSPYALSKQHCEDLILKYSKWYGLNCMIVRPFNVYGDRMATGNYATVLQIFLDAYNAKEPLKIYGDGSQRRDFTHVDDIIQGLDIVSKHGTTGEIYNIGSGENYSIKTIANLFPIEKIFIDKRNEPDNTLASIDKISKLGYEPKYNVISWLQSKINNE